MNTGPSSRMGVRFLYLPPVINCGRVELGWVLALFRKQMVLNRNGVQFSHPPPMSLNGLVPHDPELYRALARILRKFGVFAVISDDHLMFTKFDAILAVANEKIIIWKYYLPVDHNVPTLGERLATIRLADPNCFEHLRRFCNEQAGRKTAKNTSQT